MKQEQENEHWELELLGKRGNGKSENGSEMTISKCPVSCAAGRQTTPHGKRKMDEKPNVSGTLDILTQFSLMVACSH